jgi:hypothetical protein
LTDAAVVGRILREYRQRTIPPSDVQHVHGSVRGDRVSYRLRLTGGEFVTIRAARADAAVGPQFSGCTAATMVDWLSGRAATLRWLAQRGYPAPRVVPTRSGDLVGLAGAWLTLATTFVAGALMRPDLGQLGMLGEALGNLHSLPAVEEGDATGGEPGPSVAVGTSHWHPDAAIPATLRRLDSVETLLPAQWRPLHKSFRQTVQAVGRHAADLPQAVVHGDAWPGNAILAGVGVPGGAHGGLSDGFPGGTDSGRAELILIGWETSGIGLPLLDLGYCLLECHLNPDLPTDQPRAWHIQPDDRRIAAVADGYSRRRILPPGEQELLLEGIRFGAAFIGAIHFEQALLEGVRGAAMDARLDLLHNRLAVSQAVAERASHHLTGSGKRYAEPGRPEAAGA